MKKIKRIYSHYTEWEDYQNGMYKELKDDESINRVSESVILLSTPILLYEAMLRVVNNWSKASDFNLSNKSCNRRAWLGQSACSIAIGATDTETKNAWWTISKKERNMANLIADSVINEYEKKYWREIHEEKIRD